MKSRRLNHLKSFYMKEIIFYKGKLLYMLVCRNLSAYETVIHLPNTLTCGGILNEILIVYKIEA